MTRPIITPIGVEGARCPKCGTVEGYTETTYVEICEKCGHEQSY